jgi:hypothetical protein
MPGVVGPTLAADTPPPPELVPFIAPLTRALFAATCCALLPDTATELETKPAEPPPPPPHAAISAAVIMLNKNTDPGTIRILFFIAISFACLYFDLLTSAASAPDGKM